MVVNIPKYNDDDDDDDDDDLCFMSSFVHVVGLHGSNEFL